jgi:hypothetical protein
MQGKPIEGAETEPDLKLESEDQPAELGENLSGRFDQKVEESEPIDKDIPNREREADVRSAVRQAIGDVAGEAELAAANSHRQSQGSRRATSLARR